MLSVINKIHNVPVSIKTEINNGTLSTLHAMPQKDSTSDNQSSFSADRRAYGHTSTMYPTITKMNPPHSGINRVLGLPTVFDGTHTTKQKKWSGNRDASEVTRRARIQGVGSGSTNVAAGQPLSFESHANANTVNHALRRVRGGGAVAPPKKGHNTHNAYSPSPKNIPLVQPIKIVNGIKMPPNKYAGPVTRNTIWQYKTRPTP
jgi:hypothetical protein